MPVPLTTYGDDKAVNELRDQVTKAARQLSVHANNIRSGKWASEGFSAVPSVGVIVTFGHVEAANSPFFRRPIVEKLSAEGVLTIPFVVLSIEELDTLMSLVEAGKSMDDMMASLASADGSFDVLCGIRSEGGKSGVSRLLREKCLRFLDSIPPKDSRES